MVTQRYQFESNSQLSDGSTLTVSRCLWSHKDTNLKAIHNKGLKKTISLTGVYGHTKIPIWKQFTTISSILLVLSGCLWSHKDTNLKAIHNGGWGGPTWQPGVYGHTKIPIWKQFTTGQSTVTDDSMVFMVTQRYQFESNSQRLVVVHLLLCRCLWSHKDTNLKAIHNHTAGNINLSLGVYGHTKIPIWKQFTTEKTNYDSGTRCLWSHKDTNLKAIHNCVWWLFRCCLGVYGHTKIPIWKQFTTEKTNYDSGTLVFMVTQRYQFESNSQHGSWRRHTGRWCLWSHKDTNLKAIHNVLYIFWVWLLVFMVTQRYQFESNSQLDAALGAEIPGVYGHTKIPIWKQFTTIVKFLQLTSWVFMVTQRYQFESNSQLPSTLPDTHVWCLWSHKDTNLKAIHNYARKGLLWTLVFMVTQRYQFESNSQQTKAIFLQMARCLWSHKDTNLKAIHNGYYTISLDIAGVYGHTKIPIWKQFTTGRPAGWWVALVFMVTQRYQFESNSQQELEMNYADVRCLWSHKDTNLKAIHNLMTNHFFYLSGVYGHTKILIWKQFTTEVKVFVIEFRCLWSHKDTNLKAIHNIA